MSYHRDGSPFSLVPGSAYPHILNFGWLTQSIPFATGDGGGWEPLKELANTLRLWITRGHHICEFCEWDNPDHGNGEIWLRIGQRTVRFPRMIWHYIKEHRYSLPAPIMAAIAERRYTVYTDDEIDEELRTTGSSCISVPWVRCVATWKEARYPNLMAFSKANGLNWHFTSSYVSDGYYVAEPHLFPERIKILFESNPESFPDTLIFKTEVGPNSVVGG